MKAQVLKFLQNLPQTAIEQFNEAFKLYQQCKTARFVQIRYLNAAGFTKYNLENLLYDLQQIEGITQKEILEGMPVKFSPVNPYAIPRFSKGKEGNMARQKFVKANDIEVDGKSNKVMDPAIAQWSKEMTKAAGDKKAQVESEKGKDGGVKMDVVFNDEAMDLPSSKEEVFAKAPGDVKEYVSLHEEFPFLDEDDCPEELKILVSDKRKHYHKWVDAHKELLVVASEGSEAAAMTPEQIYDMAVQAVDNFEANQAIFAELDHYKKENKILGEHPIFLKRQLKDKIDNMTMADAAKRQSNLDNYIRRDCKALEKEVEKDKVEGAGDIDAINKLEKKIEGWKIELGLVLAKLGASEK